MSDRESAPEDPRVARFWRAYLETLRLFRVPERAPPWYRHHVESFMRANLGVRLREQTTEKVGDWLEAQGRYPRKRLPVFPWRQGSLCRRRVGN
ncbi:hypothetical protein [endosymbiont of unidentified scaly snail isolate Monju]|uniref:hypothetical protein n=1 Tax=endosymbiont of unidentified scaly snail isolate Monju TaxID=1248727 RepID=UPI0011DD1139|nr:hypothetical protein [endosymbiont of unidentified scaly snail isolate Monju]